MTRISGTGSPPHGPASSRDEQRPQSTSASGSRRLASAASSALPARRVARAQAGASQPATANLPPRGRAPAKRSRDESGLDAGAGASGSGPAGAKTRRRMGCDVLAASLKMLADNPLNGLAKVAKQLEVPANFIARYVGRDGLRKGPEVFQAFPDYPEHAASIQDSLRRMGRPEDAEALAAEPATEGRGRERKPVTAQMVFDALSASQRDGGRKPAGTMREWVTVEGWQQRNLADRLAKTADYPEWREQIQACARALGILPAGHQLPEPAAKARRGFGADQLVRALRLVLERRQAAAGGGPRLPAWKQHLRDSLGLDTDTVFNWITSEGRLRRPASSVSQLPGYEQASARIRQLLTELGHADLVTALPEGAGQRQRMCASKIVEGLAALADNPGISMKALELTLGITYTQLVRYLGIDGAPMPLEQIADMPDYASNVGALRDGLLRLGRPEVAAALPTPRRVADVAGSSGMSAHELLGVADARLHDVVDVARALRAEPGKPLEDITRAGGSVRPLARILLDEQGMVREVAHIEPMLTGADAGTRMRLNRLLDRLAAAIAPAAAASPAQHAPMKPVLLTAWGNAPDRMLIVDRETTQPTAGSRARLRGIYAANPGLIQAQRSYEGERVPQVLRWLSTVLKRRFPEGHEIQCFFRPATGSGPGTIVVSSNLRDVNERLQAFLQSDDLEVLLDEAGAQGPADQTDRGWRHGTKLGTRINPAADPHPTPESDEVFAAIAARHFHVPLRGEVFNGMSVNLHAERRIQNELGKTFQESVDLKRLAGTMRPCGSCADELGAAPEVHRGPYWMNRSARAGTSSDEAMARDAQAGAGTSITLARNGRLTFEHDTDSDSDAEPAE
ncbi:hypothetical protein SB778_09375 [Paraburkholderia sp. SIMBA_050]